MDKGFSTDAILPLLGLAIGIANPRQASETASTLLNIGRFSSEEALRGERRQERELEATVLPKLLASLERGETPTIESLGGKIPASILPTLAGFQTEQRRVGREEARRGTITEQRRTIAQLVAQARENPIESLSPFRQLSELSVDPEASEARDAALRTVGEMVQRGQQRLATAQRGEFAPLGPGVGEFPPAIQETLRRLAPFPTPATEAERRAEQKELGVTPEPVNLESLINQLKQGLPPELGKQVTITPTITQQPGQLPSVSVQATPRERRPTRRIDEVALSETDSLFHEIPDTETRKKILQKTIDLDLAERAASRAFVPPSAEQLRLVSALVNARMAVNTIREIVPRRTDLVGALAGRVSTFVTQPFRGTDPDEGDLHSALNSLRDQELRAFAGLAQTASEAERAIGTFSARLPRAQQPIGTFLSRLDAVERAINTNLKILLSALDPTSLKSVREEIDQLLKEGLSKRKRPLEGGTFGR